MNRRLASTLVLIVALCDVLSANSCPPDYTLLSDDACYRLSTVVRSRSDAERDCNSVEGGHLATIDGTTETFEDIMASLAAENPPDYLWISQQTDMCQALSRYNGWQIVTYDCEAELSYICQTDSTTETEEGSSSSNERFRRAVRKATTPKRSKTTKKPSKKTTTRRPVKTTTTPRRTTTRRVTTTTTPRRVLTTTTPRVVSPTTAKPKDACSASDRPVTVSSLSGSITSPHFPNPYNTNANCQWIIVSALTNGMVRLSVNFFFTVPNFDYLNIHDGNGLGNSSTQIAYLTGYYSGTTDYYSSGRYMFLQFTSSASTTSSGFNATYTSFSCPNGDDFWCSSNRQCITQCHVCDGVYDCYDGADESNCSANCTADQYRCSNGQCIPQCRRCDGYNDCGDYSDEYNCYQYSTTPSPSLCRPDQFRCLNNYQCVSSCSVCDGQVSCYDGSDENCSCNDRQFRCTSGQCVPIDARCDGSYDCWDASDETNCPCQPSYSRLCGPGYSCVSTSLICDGWCYCSDCSDEHNCNYTSDACSPERRPQILQDAGGVISSPSFPSTYYNNANCQWRIVAAVNEIIQLQFTTLRTESYCDFVNLYDGSSDANTLIISLFGSIDSNQIFYSSGQYMFVKFTSDRSIVYTGFNATYSSINSTGVLTGSCPSSYSRLCGPLAPCVPTTLSCDGSCYCSNCSDELNCSCTSSQYRCANGRCINYRCAQCDGYCDCLDCSDENNCTCTANQFQCQSSGRCLSLYSYCNGYCDCSDCSDEPAQCVTACTTNQFRCSTGNCIQLYQYCNGYCNCNSCEDEPSNCFNGTCLASQFTCSSSKTCLPSNARCNGNCECSDCSDETNCTIACTSSQFNCPGSNTCLRACLRCDGWCDCGDCSDELNCTCSSDQVRCLDTGRCIASYNRCDMYCACSDCSDELNCTCSSDQVRCLDTGRCIASNNRCNMYCACSDCSDELNCIGQCGALQPHCNNGWCLVTRRQCPYDYYCTPNQYWCDGYRDCPDGSDELNCTSAYVSTTTPNPSSTPNPFAVSPNCSAAGDYLCGDGECLHLVTTCTTPWCNRLRNWNFRCDGYNDCADHSDEQQCREITQSTCRPGQFKCSGNSTNICIAQYKWCDGYTDCSDGSDEINCPCQSYQFQCANRQQCISSWGRCDGYTQCADGSDEFGCACSSNQFRCKNGQCTYVYSHCKGYSYCFDHSDQSNCTCGENQFQCTSTHACISPCNLCDGRWDCGGRDDSDERNCTCDATTQFQCRSGGCIPKCKQCNGRNDCHDGSDEIDCSSGCPKKNQFRCASGQCVSNCYRCDGYTQCWDGSDESNCTGISRYVSIPPTLPTPRTPPTSIGFPTFSNLYSTTTYSNFPGNASQSDACSPQRQPQILWNATGTFSSPSFPSSYYNYADCQWRIVAPSSEIIELQFTIFQTESYSDYVYLYDGSSAADSLIVSLSGSILGQMFYSSGQYMFVRFTSDGSVVYTGFNANYRFVNATGAMACSNKIMCNNSRCYHPNEQCDGVNNCGDYTDELGCYCSYYSFRCNMGLCLGNSAWCNGVRDCPDGSDELPNCTQNGCLPSQFACHNGRCVDIYSKCNGINNCGDFSDEITCNCTDLQFKCQMGMCLDDDYWCNGYSECPDSSDELPGCNGTCPPSIAPSRFCEPLNKSICPPQICDSVQDCPDDSDEVNCTCQSHQYGCQNGRCIYKQWLCDGVKDCPLGDDELPSLCSHCASNQFQCVRATNTCINAAQQCDGVPQCPDLSDESNCVSFSGSTNQLVIKYRGTPDYYVCSSLWTTAFSDKLCQDLGHVSSLSTQNIAVSLGTSVNWLSLSPGANSSNGILASLQQSTCSSRLSVAIICADYQCGRRSANISNFGPYIIDGQWALRGAWPWQVMLKVDGSFYCGGSLINDRWILTAAHCTRSPYDTQLSASQYSIRLGSLQASGSDADLLVSGVDRVFTNPTYDSYNIINDVGLLRLSNSVVLTDTIRPICLPASDVNVNQFRVCVDTGFGRIGPPPDPTSDRLLQVRMNIMTPSECRQSLENRFGYNYYFNMSIYETTILCIGTEPTEGIGICKGDSGGPLACQDQHGSWTVIGVNSFGPSYCAQGFVARVPTYVDWIQQTIAANP